jgi:hypothetical protein
MRPRRPVEHQEATAMRLSCKLLIACNVGGWAFGSPMAGAARADDRIESDELRPDDASRRAIDRTWLYADDARLPAPLEVIATSSVSYTNLGSSPTRISSPFPNTYNGFATNTAQPGGMLSLGGELGILPRLSVTATGQMGFGGVDGVPNPSAGAIAGVRFSVLPTAWTRMHLAVSGGYLREAWSGPVYDDDDGKWLPGSPHGDNGAWLRVAWSGDFERVRLAATVHGEHVFSAGRDPLDVMVTLGASYRIVGGFRAGAEYVGQDLEETFSPEADGGARHFLGPIASLQLLGDRLTVVAGPAIGLSDTSPSFVGRLSASYGF